MFDPKTEAKKREQTIIERRRALHRIPETHTDLPQTTAFIKNALQAMGLAYTEYSNGGLRAVLKGGKPGRTIALRADMDALPVKEETGLPFASENGNMHACGHDAHVSMLLAAAEALMEHREELAGNVIFLFQPAEETTGGAKTMVEEGCLKDPDADCFFCLHIGSILGGVPNGCFGYRKGPLFAGASTYDVTIKGKGGHGGRPNECVDPVLIACEIVQSLQKIVSRELPPVHGNVITVGQIHGGSSYNIVPDEVTFAGTVRTIYPEDTEYMEKRIPQLIRDIAKANRAEAEIDYHITYPPVVNDPAMTDFFTESARKVLGPDKIVEIPEPTTGAEDATFYLLAVPGCYGMLGSLKPHEDGIVYPHHNARFDIDESTMWLGTALFLQAVLDVCSPKTGE